MHARRIDLGPGSDGSREVSVTDALRIARDGVPVILERALQEIGVFDRVVDLYLHGVTSVASPAVAADLRRRGLQHLHEVCTPPQVAAMIGMLDAPAKALTIPLTRAIVERTAPAIGNRYFIAARSFVRAQVPYRLLDDYPELSTAGHLGGHLVPIGIHRDSALTHPPSTVSIWSAVGPVQSGNSVAVYATPGAPPLTPALAPGDVLLFQSDLPHASVPNETEETRVSIGTRMLHGTRIRYGPGNHWRPYFDMRLVDTPFAALATLESCMTVAAARRWRFRRRWEREQRRSGGAENAPSLKR